MGTVGAIAIAVVMTVAWVSGQAWSNHAMHQWLERSDARAMENIPRIGTTQGLEPSPEKSFAAEHPNLLSALIAIGAGVIGAVLVLLIAITVAVSGVDRSRRPDRP